MDSVKTVQLDSSVAATDAAVAEPDGDQGELPDHGVPEASELIGQTNPNRAVEPVLLPSGREHLCGGKKFTDYAAASRGIGRKLERHCSFHARVNKRSISLGGQHCTACQRRRSSPNMRMWLLLSTSRT